MTLQGRSLPRFEDARFLRGAGRFIADLPAPDAAWAVVLRSPHAHARLCAIEADAARAMPGVLGVFTHADLAADGIGDLPCVSVLNDGSSIIVPPRPALARGRVRHVGDPVALVVARTRTQARDAMEQVAVRYDALPAIVDAVAALRPDAPLLWPEAPGNCAFRFTRGDAAAVEAAMARAAQIVDLRLRNNRLVAAPLETRMGIARVDPASGAMDLLLSAQGVHGIRDVLADAVFRIPRAQLRVHCPDVGGGFGPKNVVYPEYVLALWAARRLGCPVRFENDRTEDFLSSAQARDSVTHARLALDAAGHFLALQVETVADMGAYLSTSGPGSSTNAPSTAMGGVYAIPAIAMAVRGAFTNSVPIDAYRGAGKPEANYLIERLAERAARERGEAPLDLRARNLIAQHPYRSALGISIESGQFPVLLERARALADPGDFARRRAAARARGILLGEGFACFLETSRGAPNEGAAIRFPPGGGVEIALGSQSNGQGHETSFPQIAADLLGLPIEALTYVQADTARVADGHGHGGARSLHMAGTALVRAAEALIAKAHKLAARVLQVDPAMLEWRDGRFHRHGQSLDGGLGLLALAAALGADAGQLDTELWNVFDAIVFPAGCHRAEVAVDPETGLVRLLAYRAVDDYGRLVNPMLTIGQVHGGLAQGIGQALLEEAVFEAETGQILSASWMDYAMPRAGDLPVLEVLIDGGLPTPANPLGVKGVGQAGAIGAPQTVMAAILDALSPLGVRDLDMPATPERVWRAIHAAGH